MIPYFGLYFGTTNLCLAMHKDGKTEVLANAAGDRVTPAVVAFLNGEKSVGLAAKQGMYRNVSNTVTHVKCLIGGDESMIKEEMKRSKCKIITEGGLKYEVEQDGKLKRYTPTEILFPLFHIMKVIAESHSHEEEIYPAVVTVPLNFTSDQRNIIQEVTTKCGFQLLRVVSEPAAALLAYKIGQESTHSFCNCLVYRMGGTSVDVTVIRVISGLYSVLSYIRKRTFGGSLFTDAIVSHCAYEFQRQYKVDVTENRRSLIKLQSAAETCKHVLSSLGSAQCFAESVYDGIDLSINVSRARFESLISGTLQQCMEPINEAVEDSNLTKMEINKIILAGGSCKVPKLQQLIGDMFPSATLLNTFSPDEVIAIGAAEEAALLSEEDSEDIGEDDCFVETLSQGIYVKVVDSESISTFYPMIPSGTPVPTRLQHKFKLPANQTSLCLEVYQGLNILDSAAGDQKNVTLLAKLNMNSLMENSEVTAVFHVRSDGSLHVACTDDASNGTQSVTVEASKENES